MLWYDDDKKSSLEEKVRRAIEFYFVKFNVKANRCWVNPKQMDEGITTVDGVSVKPDREVIKNHLWIGVE